MIRGVSIFVVARTIPCSGHAGYILRLHQDAGFGAKAALLGDGLIAFTSFFQTVGAVITGSESLLHPLFSKGAAHGCFIFHIWLHNHLQIKLNLMTATRFSCHGSDMTAENTWLFNSGLCPWDTWRWSSAVFMTIKFFLAFFFAFSDYISTLTFAFSWDIPW